MRHFPYSKRKAKGHFFELRHFPERLEDRLENLDMSVGMILWEGGVKNLLKSESESRVFLAHGKDCFPPNVDNYVN